VKEGAQATAVGKKTPSAKSPMAGHVGSAAAGKPREESKDPSAKKQPVPMVVDVESSQQPLDPNEKGKSSPKNSGGGRLGLPATILAGGAKEGDSCPANQKMDEAVTKQQDLLAEFDKIADELNRVLANLEGSTLVKRLKAASRLQYRIAGRISDQVSNAFGLSTANRASRDDLPPARNLNQMQAKL